MKPLLIGCAALATALTCLAPAANASLLLQYQFDEAAGANAADTGTGAPAPGTLVNSAWTTNTPSGSGAAVDTSGASSASLRYVSAGDVDKLDGLSAFTLTTWINLQATPTGNRRIMSKQAATSFDGFAWNISDAGDGSARSASAFGARLFVGGSSGFAFDAVPSDPAFVINADHQWTFLAVSYDGTQTSDNVHYYAGSASGAVTLLATTTVNAGTTNASSAVFGLGYTDAAPTADTSLPGYIDDARVYDAALSAQALDAVRLSNVPEPATLSLLALGATSLLTRRRRAQ
jgi:hypothetical protein